MEAYGTNMASHKQSAQESAAETGAVIVREIASAALPRAPLIRAAPAALGTLAKQGYSLAEIHALVVPKRTLARRQAANEPLSVEETDKALRLERVASLAARVFGSTDKANRWLRKPKRQLDGDTPLAFLGSEAGARVVEEMLQRIDFGMVA